MTNYLTLRFIKIILVFSIIIPFSYAYIAGAEQKERETRIDSTAISQRIAKITGSYNYEVKIQMNPNNKDELTSVANALTLIPVAKNLIYFSTNLNFDYGHQCNLSGIAQFNKDNEFIYLASKDKEMMEYASEQDKKCYLKFILNKNEIAVEDNNTCRIGCGARGYFDGHSFPLSAKKIISKNSPDIQKAHQKYLKFTSFNESSFEGKKTPTLADSCTNPQSPYDKTYCISKLFLASDKELNESYAALKNILNKEQKNKLTQAQRSWIKFRHDTCSNNGTTNVACNIAVNKSRTDFLRERIEECKKEHCRNDVIFKQDFIPPG